MALSMASQVCREPNPISVVVDGELMMLSAESNSYLGFNAVGTRIWDLLDKPISAGELCESLLDEFDITGDQCEKEVLAFLNDLLRRRLIRICNECAA